MASKVVLIAGGTSGVGRSLAEQSLRSGHRVFVTGTTPNHLDDVLALADRAHLDGQVSDLSDWESTRGAVAAAVAHFGRLDAVVASAGRGAAGDLADGDPAAWRNMVLTNVLGPAHLVRAALPALGQTRGQVVLIGSVFGRKPARGSVYSATKSAVAALAESLRQQVVGSGIRVCAVHPGRIDTPWWPDGAAPPALSAEAVAASVGWVLGQGPDIDVNELVIRPVGQPH